MTEREKIATFVVSNPHIFKVCEGCDSIVRITTDICPSCHGYRFDADKQRVVETANLLGSRPAKGVNPEDMF